MIFDVIRTKEKNLIEDFGLRIGHNLSDGKYREFLIQTILGIIPGRYKTSNGFIFDSRGTLSKEMDIIIFDGVYVPNFFNEVYSLIPIESVVATIQVKTRLTSQTLIESISNLNSVDVLIPERNGMVISASNGVEIQEKRIILPYKIIVAGTSDTPITIEKVPDIDMVYTIKNEQYDILLIKKTVVNSIISIIPEHKKDNLIQERNGIKDYEVIKNDKLAHFIFRLLQKLTIINNSMIINYPKYEEGIK